MIALCGGVVVITAVVVVLVLALLGMLGGHPQTDPVVQSTSMHTRPVEEDVTVQTDLETTQGPADATEDAVPQETEEPTEEDDRMTEGGPETTQIVEEIPVTEPANVVDCISCGGSGDCVACEGEKRCPYCKGSGVEQCYVCWGTDLCDRCMGAGKDTRGEKCIGCNGKGTCTFDTCTGGYEPCWKCDGQKPCYLCNGDGVCLTCGGEGSYDLNGPIRRLTAYRKVEHDDCWYGKTRCEGSACNEGACSYQDCNGTGKLVCLSCKGSDQCQTCTNNPRYEDRTCRSCDDTGECSLCEKGYDPCYMCEGSGKCGTCNGIYEKDDRMCIDGYTFEDYPYTIGVEQSTSQTPVRDPASQVSPGGDCTKCGGDGWWCTRCNGSGDCNNLNCITGYVTCSKCSGAKSCNNCWYWTDRTKHCSACDDTRDCNKCKGDGRLKCTTCKGSGECPTCKGEYWCDECGGSGFMS